MKKRFAIAACSAQGLALLLFGLAQFPPPAQAQVFTEPTKPARTPTTKPRPRPSSSPPRSVSRSSDRGSTYSDPVKYCTAVGDADRAGPSYTGAAIPQWIAEAAFQNSETVRSEDRLAIREGRAPARSVITWRCKDKSVSVCYDVNGAHDCDKVPQPATAGPELRRYCQNRSATTVPAHIQGYSLPVWECRNGTPIRNKYVSVDARGFIVPFWKEITRQDPKTKVGDVARTYLGDWRARGNQKGFLANHYVVGLHINEGPIGAEIGQIDYFVELRRGQPTHICSSKLTLNAASSEALTVQDTVIGTKGIGCPANKVIILRPQGGRLSIEWQQQNRKKLKTTMTGWAER